MDKPLPAPISIVPSGEFHGNDGPWSTFPIQIGTPPQTVQSLISTASSQTWAVLPDGCVPTDGVADCTNARGGSYQPNDSSTWEQNRVVYHGYINLTLSDNLNVSSVTNVGEYGLDTVALKGQSSQGPKLDKQLVAGIATKEYFLGLFGLNGHSQPLLDNDEPLPNYLASLNSSSTIPSFSWGYTAGNQYRSGPPSGSLTLGGYDSSRFVPNNLGFPINGTDTRSLAVQIGRIILTTAGYNDVVDTPGQSITAVIDSTTPYMIFPDNVCAEFEFQFGITWDETSELYLVNDTQHDILSANDTSVTITIGNTQTTPGEGVNITLPYAAFNLTASPPLTTNASRYFPLKRAANDNQITLGRSFLQEAYLIVDYEHNNFSVSQCDWEGSSQEHIVAITRSGSKVSSSNPKSGGLSGGAIAGIVIGVLAFLAILVGAFFLFRRKFKVTKKPTKPPEKPEMTITELPTTNDPFDIAAQAKALPQSPELDVIEHKGHELDASGHPDRDSVPVYPQQGQQTAYELDANTRRSLSQSSPISPWTPRTNSVRFSHQRTLSDPSSVESGEDRTSELATVNSQRVSKISHQRTLSDPSSVEESTQGGTVVEEPVEGDQRVVSQIGRTANGRDPEDKPSETDEQNVK